MVSVFLMLKKILSTILHHNPFLHQRLNFSQDLLNIRPDLQGGFVISNTVFGIKNLQKTSASPVQELSLLTYF